MLAGVDRTFSRIVILATQHAEHIVERGSSPLNMFLFLSRVKNTSLKLNHYYICKCEVRVGSFAGIGARRRTIVNGFFDSKNLRKVMIVFRKLSDFKCERY